MKAAILLSTLRINLPLMASTSEQQCSTAGDKAVQAKRLIERGESPENVSSFLPVTKVEEEAVHLAINNLPLNQDDLRFLAVKRCKIMLRERQQMFRERQRRE